jgi:preprotein translocase subunit SecG
MISFFIILLVLVCIILMAAVLMQSSKGSGLVGPIGGAGVTTMFGARRTSDFLSKTTVVLGVSFLLVSLLLNIYISKSGGNEGRESGIQKNAREFSPPGTMPMQNQPPPNNQTQPPIDNQQQQNNNQQDNNKTP